MKLAIALVRAIEIGLDASTISFIIASTVVITFVVAAFAVVTPAIIAAAAVAIATVGLPAAALDVAVPVGLSIGTAITATIPSILVSASAVGGAAAVRLVPVVAVPVAVLALLCFEHEPSNGTVVEVTVMLETHEVCDVLHRGVLQIIFAVA